MPAGRPSTYSAELAERVCEAFAESHSSLHDVFSSRDDLPSLSTVYRWEEAHAEFREQLTRARAARSNVLAEQALKIADYTADDDDTRMSRSGVEYDVPDHEWITRSRLRVETRLRLARAMNPRVYGEKVSAELSGPQGGPISIGWKEGA